MTRRLLLSYLTITVAVLLLLEVPLGLFYAQRERGRFLADVERDASVIATIYEDDLEAGRTPDPRPAQQYQARTGARVVVVDRRGISLVDTEQAPPRDFSTRPEIATALSGRRASGLRPSETLHTDLLFVALPVASSGIVHGALRVTLGTSDIDSHINRFWFALGLIAVVVLAAMALLGWAMARSVTRPVRRLHAAAARFASGDLTPPDPPSGRGAQGPPELRALADTMADMAVQLAALIDEQRAFVADASHQLRTPLTALRLRLENLQARLGSIDAAELDTAIEEIERLAALVTDLLQLARADRPDVPIKVDVVALAADRVDTWSAVAEVQDVHLVLRAPPRALVLAGPGAIEQILDNVLDNALAVAPVGSEVVVTVEVVTADSGEQARLTIADRGPGLSDDDKQKALRRFWRGRTGTPGSGLGLPIAATLARGSGGRLALADHDGGGLLVIVTFPVAPTAPVGKDAGS